MRKEYVEMEATLKAKLIENQRLATEQNEKMQKAINKQKADIELVIELNESLKLNKKRLEEKNAKIEAEVKKERERQKEILDSLSETDAQKVRASLRLDKQDKEMERMNMLYRQVASEKAAVNRKNDILQEKLEKKRQKMSYLKQQLEETTLKFERVRDENQQYGQIISQVIL